MVRRECFLSPKEAARRAGGKHENLINPLGASQRSPGNYCRTAFGYNRDYGELCLTEQFPFHVHTHTSSILAFKFIYFILLLHPCNEQHKLKNTLPNTKDLHLEYPCMKVLSILNYPGDVQQEQIRQQICQTRFLPNSKIPPRRIFPHEYSYCHFLRTSETWSTPRILIKTNWHQRLPYISLPGYELILPVVPGVRRTRDARPRYREIRRH